MSWFVMLHQGGDEDGPVPLVREDESPALFASESDADRMAARNPLGRAFGWEAYQWYGYGTITPEPASESAPEDPGTPPANPPHTSPSRGG